MAPFRSMRVAGETAEGRKSPKPWGGSAWLAWFGAATLVGVLFAGQHVAARLYEGEAVSWAVSLRWYLLDWWIWAGLGVVVFRVVERFPLERAGLGLAVAAHFFAAPTIVVLQTALFGFLSEVLTLNLRVSPTPLDAFVRSLSIWWLPKLVVYAVMAGFFHLLRYRREAAERGLRESRLEARLAEAELEALRMQLQPHFLFNTLNVISETLHEDPEAADGMIGHLSELLRVSLQRAGEPEVTLEEELSALDPYLEIERARFEGRLEVFVRVADGCQGARVPALLLQPLVENAIRHGVAPSPRAGWVAIEVERTGDRLRLGVRDSGGGPPVGRRASCRAWGFPTPRPASGPCTATAMRSPSATGTAPSRCGSRCPSGRTGGVSGPTGPREARHPGRGG